MKRLAKADKQAVEVGFPRAGTLKSKKQTNVKNYAQLVDIAAYNHFGTKDGRIPSRPFMTIAMRGQYKQRIQNVVRKESVQLMDPNSRMPVSISLDRIGLAAVAQHKRAIRDLKSPPNAPSTVKAKGGGTSNPLIDTGTMINSLQHVKVRSFV